MTSVRKLALIVAMDEEYGIGKAGKLPWNIRKDMKFFASTTKSTNDSKKRNAVIMGRKCWESIPENRRPLPGRLNIVLSRTMQPSTSSDVIITNDLHEVMLKLTQPPYCDEIETVWNIGGKEIYELALKNRMVEKMWITRIFSKFDTDVKLDSIDWSKFSKYAEDENEVHEENGIHFAFEKWIST